MQSKSNMLSIRLTNEEYTKLKRDADAAKMSASQYIRQLIIGNTPKADDGKQDMVRQMCKLYTVINEEKLDNNAALMREVEVLCRKLY